MNKLAIIILLVGFSFALCHAADPDILVTQEGESLKVYNLEVSANSVFYTLTESSDAPVEKLNKSAVLIIKKADGSVLNINEALKKDNKANISVKASNPVAHDPITHKAMESDFFIVEKKDKHQPIVLEKYILVSDGKEQVLNMKVLSEEDKTLSVWKPRKDQDYNLTKYVIPEYVMIGNDRYTVEEIGPKAFYSKNKLKGKKITDILFPETLKTIRNKAFSRCYNLNKIILPEGIKNIEELAFNGCGLDCSTFEQLYIPKGVTTIEKLAFFFIGPNRSPNGYFQGNLTCIPDFITTGNCTSYGIDEEAVEAYEKRKR